MLPQLALQPLWYAAAIFLPAVQSLHAVQTASPDQKMWLFYWVSYVLGGMVFPYVEWLVRIPFMLLSYVVDLYLEVQVIGVLALVLPKPLLLKQVFERVMSNMDTLAVVAWNGVLLVSIIPAWIVSFIGLHAVEVVPKHYRPAALQTLNRVVIFTTSMGWRFTLTVCRWVELNCEGADFFCRECCASGRSAVILPNHVSFADIIFTLVLTPVIPATKVKMMVSGHVLKMPVVGIICKAMGHLSVPFKDPDATDSFEVDKDAVRKNLEALDEHIKNGGNGGWFPEGRVNPDDPTKIGQFRAGGFAVAVKNDVEVWCLANVGNAVTWPRKAPVGGRPACIGYKIMRICESSKEFCSEGADDSEKCKQLANHCNEKVQSAIDELVKAGYKGAPPVADKQ